MPVNKPYQYKGKWGHLWKVKCSIPWSTGWCDYELTIRRPLDVGRIGCFKLRNLFFVGHIPHFDSTSQVAKSGQHQQRTLGVEKCQVPRPRSKIKDGFAFFVEQSCLGRHVSVNHAELRSCWWPAIGTTFIHEFFNLWAVFISIGQKIYWAFIIYFLIIRLDKIPS